MSYNDDFENDESYTYLGGAADPSPDDLYITHNRAVESFTAERERRQLGEVINE